MEPYELAFSKLLHILIRKFILSFENYVEHLNIDRNKVFGEILKRSYNVSQGIKALAQNILAGEASGNFASEDLLTIKVQGFMKTILEQDLIECALNYENSWNAITYRDLHDCLYLCAMNDINSMSSLYMNVPANMYLRDLHMCCSKSFLPSDVSTKYLDKILLSTQFEKNKFSFDKDLIQLKLIVENTSPTVESKCSENDYNLSSQDIGCSRSVSHEFDSLKSHPSLLNYYLSQSNIKSSSSAFNFQAFYGKSWEGRMKQLVPCHLYSSEFTEEEVDHNVTDLDPHVFRSLYSLSTAVLEENIKHDILDLLIGIPSSSFLYDNNQKKFRIQPHVHLKNLSQESTAKFLEKFINCGTLFKKLQLFSTEIFHSDGFILRGLKQGIHEILKNYNEYIVAVKMKKPSMHFLNSDVLETAETLSIFETIFNPRNEELNSFELPKGLGLLSHLNKSLWSQRRSDNAVMIAVVMKYAYMPYLNFLDRWIDEGICFDPYREFQIIEDIKYLDRRDELYWKFAYTENIEDATRTIPTEIQSFSQDILECGKNMKLLKICCSEMYSLDYMTKCPAPSLSLLFSYTAALAKAENCCFYFEEKKKEEAKYFENKRKISEEELLLYQQSLVCQKDIYLQNTSKGNYMFPKFTNFDSCSVKKVSDLKKYNSWENLVPKHNLYSDIIFKHVGVLFSSCDLKSEQVDHSSFIKVLPSQLCNSYANSELLENESFNKINHSTSGLYLNQTFSSEHDFNSSQAFSQNSQRSANVSFSQKTVRDYSFTKDFIGNELWEKDSNMVCNISSKELFSKASQYILPGTLMSNLTALLIDDATETKHDVYSYLQLSSLQSLLFYSFKPVLDMRLHMMKKVVMDFVMNQLKLEDLLVCLKNTYLLLDESFSQLLLEKLFPWTLKSQTMEQFSNWSILNEMFCNALSERSCGKFPFLSTGSVIIVDLPERDILERTEYLHLFQFEFKVSWPLNIIIHQACIADYMKAFSFLLELDFLCWLLGRTWRKYMSHYKAADIQNAPQFKEIMLNRFEMHQFLSVLRNCIRHDLQGPVWHFLSKKLSSEEFSIDALEEIHGQYLQQVLTRCFLTTETKLLHELLVVMSRQVYRFCIWSLECSWELNGDKNQYETLSFRDLTSVSEIYKKYQKAFYDRIWKMSATRKYGVSKHEGFKQYLEFLLESKGKY